MPSVVVTDVGSVTSSVFVVAVVDAARRFDRLPSSRRSTGSFASMPSSSMTSCLSTVLDRTRGRHRIGPAVLGEALELRVGHHQLAVGEAPRLRPRSRRHGRRHDRNSRRKPTRHDHGQQRQQRPSARRTLRECFAARRNASRASRCVEPLRARRLYRCPSVSIDRANVACLPLVTLSESATGRCTAKLQIATGTAQ